MQVRIDSTNPGGEDLWIGRLDRRFDFGSQRERMATQQALWTYACEHISQELLAALPARNPSAETHEPNP